MDRGARRRGRAQRGHCGVQEVLHSSPCITEKSVINALCSTHTHTHSHTAAVVETKSARKVAALHQLASSTGRRSWLGAKCGPKVR